LSKGELKRKKNKQMKERTHKTLFQQIILYEWNYSCGSLKNPNFPNDSAP
jgi:predicted double-glycine peptidase